MKRMIPIWFFVGSLLSIYGLLILAAGVQEPSADKVTHVVMDQLHLQLWWGGGLLILGLIYVVRFWPGGNSNH
jgi:hypothetical protein